MVRRNAAGEDVVMGTVQIDRMIRRQVEAMGKQMEGGGLMVPLSEIPKPVKARKRKTSDRGAKSTMEIPILPSAPHQASAASGTIPQYDGPGDSNDDEEDEDAINSDLDDPADDHDQEDDDDEALGHIMLCMYDKVQRVKNKWKCVLKDGILVVGGRE
jgi:transcription initiation factor TFIIA large subunit